MRYRSDTNRAKFTSLYRRLDSFQEASLQACLPGPLFGQRLSPIRLWLGWERLQKTAWSMAFPQVQRDLLWIQRSHLSNRIFNCYALQQSLEFGWCASSPGFSLTFGKWFDLLWHLFGQRPAAHLLIANAAIPFLWSNSIHGGSLSA